VRVSFDTSKETFTRDVPLEAARGDPTTHAGQRQSYFDLLTKWQGYPVEIHWAQFFRADTIGKTFEEVANATRARRLLGWIEPPRFPDDEDQFVRIVKADGSAIGPSTNATVSNFPTLQSDRPCFIGSIRIIQSPGRTDSDGSVQPDTNPPGVTEGEYPLNTLQQTDRPDFSKGSFRARIVSSRVLPEFRPPLTPEGLELDRATRVSSHQLVVEVADRVAAGLSDTPLSLGDAIYEQYKIGNRRFYLRGLEEKDDDALTLTLNTSRFD